MGLAVRGPACRVRNSGYRALVSAGDHPLRREVARVPGAGSPDYREPGLSRTGWSLGTPEAFRKDRLRCTSRSVWSTAYSGRSGRSRQNTPARDHCRTHRVERAEAGTYTCSEATHLAVAGRIAESA